MVKVFPANKGVIRGLLVGLGFAAVGVVPFRFVSGIRLFVGAIASGLWSGPFLVLLYSLRALIGFASGKGETSGSCGVGLGPNSFPCARRYTVLLALPLWPALTLRFGRCSWAASDLWFGRFDSAIVAAAGLWLLVAG